MNGGSQNVVNVLSIDVEEAFHASEVQETAKLESRSHTISRVGCQTSRVLDLLSRHGVTATFFVVGSVADEHPELVREIVGSGHEVGCHSYAHRLVYQMTPAEFRLDTERARNAIADACGVAPRAYRAPSYSISAECFWALEILAELGFSHDSSIYPIVHDRYGIPGFGRHSQILETPAGSICEVPIATVRLSENRVAPVGGGAYLRILPYSYTAAGIRRINAEDRQPACIYFHPWELDAGQPQLARGALSRLRTYAGLRGMAGKIDRLLKDFRFSALTSVYPRVVAYSGGAIK